MKKIVLFSADELGLGEMRRVELEGKPPIAIYNLDGEFFATDDTCTHGDAALSDGIIEGDQVICPYHSGAFNIRSGEATAAPCAKEIRTYRLIVKDGVVYFIDTEEK